MTFIDVKGLRMNDKNGSGLKALFLTVLLMAIIIVTTVMAIKHFGLRFDLLRMFSRHKVYEVTQASKNLPISREPTASIDLTQIIELRQMLEDQRFEELNAILEGYQNLFENDQTSEYWVYDAYGAFHVTDPVYERSFKKWIFYSSDKYQPHLAIAQYYYAKGWESRGYKWRKDTTDEQIEEMVSYFLKAEEHVKVALKTNPDLIVGYYILTGIYNALGNDEAEDRIIQKTAKLFPYSFLIKSVSSWAKEPRWGGSYALMEEMAKDAEKYSNTNPKLTALYGFIYYDQGRRFNRNKRYAKAIDLFSKALEFGDHWSFYYERAKTYHFYLKQYDLALEDINRSIELRTALDENFRLRSRIHYANENYMSSIDDLHTAETINPGDPKTKKWRVWAAKNLLHKGHRLFKTDIPAAVEYYNLSLEWDEDNFETYYWRGVASYRLEDFESALADFEIAIKMNPGHFDSYRMIDYIFARDQQWDTIIGYWNAFLEQDPDHAGAYLERSGTHYHNKDFENALNDLNTSCELGNKAACKRYNGLKGKI